MPAPNLFRFAVARVHQDIANFTAQKIEQFDSGANHQLKKAAAMGWTDVIETSAGTEGVDLDELLGHAVHGEQSETAISIVSHMDSISELAQRHLQKAAQLGLTDVVDAASENSNVALDGLFAAAVAGEQQETSAAVLARMETASPLTSRFLARAKDKGWDDVVDMARDKSMMPQVRSDHTAG